MMNRDAQQGGSADGGDGHGGPDGEGEGLEARLRSLEARLAERKPQEEPATDGGFGYSGFAQAFRLSSEFIAAVALGFALGYGFDRLFGTKPWGMIVLLLLGFCAGVLNMLRAAGMVAEPDVADRRRGGGTDDEDRRGG